MAVRGALEHRVGDHPRQHDRHRDVEHGDDAQRGQDAPRNVALRILRLLSHGGHDVEPDEREEHDRRTREHPVPAVVAAVRPFQRTASRAWRRASAQSRPATNATISSAPQSSVNEPRPTVAPVNPNTVLR